MALSREARKIRAEYQRRWRQQNPERHKEYVARYWERKAMKESQEVNKSNGNS